MKILILGSEGFIGKHLISYYSNRGNNVYGADLLEVGTQSYNYFKVSRLSPEFDEMLQQTAFDVCINAAGSGNVPYSMTHPVSDFEANSLDTIRLLDGLKRHQPHCRYLHISSAAVYGNPQSLPIQEDQLLHPLSPYGWHKLVAEQLCKEFTQVYSIPTAIIRPFSVYGPGLKKQLIWDLFQKITKAPVNDSIELWGTGAESRDFIFVTDLAAAIDLIIRNGSFNSEVFNLASGVETTIREVSEKVVREVGKPLTIKFNQQVRPGDPLNWRADISRIMSLGYRPTISLEEGLKQTAQWLKGLE